MPLLNQICQVACKVEAEEGTDVFGAGTAPAGADIFLAFNPKFTPNINMHKRAPAKSNLSPYASLPGDRSAKFSFDVEMVGAAAGSPIGATNTGANLGIASALIACGVQQTLVVATSASYVPQSDIAAAPPLSNQSVTLAFMLDGKMYKLWGCRGNAKISLEIGKPGIISFEFTGADFSEEDKSLVAAAIDLSDREPPVFQDATFTIGVYAAVCSKLEIDFGNKVSLRKDTNSASGYLSALITSREPTLKLDPENILVATYNFMSLWRAGTTAALSCVWGSTPSVMTLTAPKVQYQSVGLAEREGISTFDVNALLTQNAGDDEWSLVVT